MADVLAPVGGTPGLDLAPDMEPQPRGDIPDYPLISNDPKNLTPPGGFFKGYVENAAPTLPIPVGKSWDYAGRDAVDLQTELYPVAGTVVDDSVVVLDPLLVGAPVRDAVNLLKYVFTATGGFQPRTLYIEGLRVDQFSDSGNVTITFPGPGTYKWTATDVLGGKVGPETLVVTGVAALFTQPYPWEGFGTHQLINDWLEEQDLIVPEEWFQLTLSAKKAYLAETFGEG